MLSVRNLEVFYGPIRAVRGIDLDVQAGELPDPGNHDAVLITGSPAGVYDDYPWIKPLM